MSFLLNPYVSAFLSTLFVSTIFYLIKNVIAIYRNKASIKKAELKIIDLSLRYIYAHNKFSLDTLNSIIYGVSVKEKVKIEKLRKPNDFLSWIIVKIIDDFVLDNNQKDENIDNIISILNKTSFTKDIKPDSQKALNKRKRLITILIVAISFSYLYLGMIYLLTSPEFNEQSIFVRDDDSILIFFMISGLFVVIMSFLLTIIRYIKKSTH